MYVCVFVCEREGVVRVCVWGVRVKDRVGSG